jgi:hypothetical protein
MQEIMGYTDAFEESTPEQQMAVRDEQFIHADLDPMFNDFGPNMLG